MKKIFISILVCFLIVLSAHAKQPKTTINSLITESNVPRNAISISVKNNESGKIVYELNSKTLMHPASIQKILTLPAAIDVLGEDYEFETEIFSRGEDGYLFKLGADPYFSFSNLKTLVKNIDKPTVKKIYIDDSVLERKDWGEGWQWDDDLNTCMPRFNSYNMDSNIIKITVMPSINRDKVLIINPSKYPIVFVNNVKIAEETNVKLTRDSSIAANALTLDGTVNKPAIIKVPTNNLKGYFDFKLTQALADRNIYLKLSFMNSKSEKGDTLLSEVAHPISRAVDDILKNSNNMVIETVLKLAASKKFGEPGTDINGIKIFDSYCKKLNIDNSEIRLVDASGVSKNNLVNSDFVTEYLVKNKFNSALAHMAEPGEGTLSERLIPLKGSLKAKTGTLSDVSSIAGFLKAKSGKQYSFCIIINDPKSSNSDKKALEDYVIRELYLSLKN